MHDMPRDVERPQVDLKVADLATGPARDEFDADDGGDLVVIDEEGDRLEPAELGVLQTREELGHLALAVAVLQVPDPVVDRLRLPVDVVGEGREDSRDVAAGEGL